MKERPMLMSAPMVRALLAGTKTQTRRVVKPQPQPNGGEGLHHVRPYRNPQGDWAWVLAETGMGSGGNLFSCPYGQPGDRLWVKETGWQRPERTPRMMREGADTWAPYYFDADGLSEQDHADFKAWGFKRRPSIFMPRKCSRITLEITNARVERLQDISNEDAEAEGVKCDMSIRGFVDHYRALWEQINGPGSWAANPWVWVVEFKRVPA